MRNHAAVIRLSLSLRYNYTYYTSISVEGDLGVLQSGISFQGPKKIKIGIVIKIVGRLKRAYRIDRVSHLCVSQKPNFYLKNYFLICGKMKEKRILEFSTEAYNGYDSLSRKGSPQRRR